MQKLIYILFAAICATSCQSTSHNLGEQFEVKNTISVDSAITLLNSTVALQDVQVEGTINKSCMSEGCWLTIKDISGNEILFNVSDKKFKIPMNSPNKKAVMLVDAASTVKVNQEKSPKNELSIKGLVFK